jgi:uncharacterized protein YbjT (DUF2867 family)
VVYHAVFKADRFKDVSHFASKLAVENAIKSFDVPFTIIRPNHFFQNDVLLKEVLMSLGVYSMPLGPVGVSAVDVRDIAEATAIALTTDGQLGKTYNLNGPEVLSGKLLLLVGHDMGIPPALLWAADHPEEVSGLLTLKRP